MRVVINSKLAERYRKVATYLFLATLVVLVGGFIFVNYSLFTENIPGSGVILLQLLLIPVAFVLTLISVRLTNSWARRPYPEDVIKEGLKGVSKKSVIYHYYHDPARHVLIAPQGVFAITTRWHNGRFAVKGSEWTTFKNPISRFFSLMRMDRIGNPTEDALKAAQHIQAALQSVGAEVEVHPIILFIDPKVDVEIEDPIVPIFS
ncbi:MAG: nuclease-related domain-containing protein, partial [Anaerolineae bacterium]|nr:nuclease-related domain-containing protein [Anaerolineae bacterium]